MMKKSDKLYLQGLLMLAAFAFYFLASWYNVDTNNIGSPQNISDNNLFALISNTENTTTVTDGKDEKLVKQAIEWLETDLGKYTIEYCYENGISPYLVTALIQRESGFKTSALGDNGKAYGLGQIHPECVRDRYSRLEIASDSDLFDGRANVRMIVDILNSYFKQTEDVQFVLTAYNGGLGYAKNHGYNKYSYDVSRIAYELEQTAEQN